MLSSYCVTDTCTCTQKIIVCMLHVTYCSSSLCLTSASWSCLNQLNWLRIYIHIYTCMYAYMYMYICIVKVMTTCKILVYIASPQSLLRTRGIIACDLWNYTCTEESLEMRLHVHTHVYTCIIAVSRMVRVISLLRSTSGQRCLPLCSFTLWRWRWGTVCVGVCMWLCFEDGRDDRVQARHAN